MHDIRAANVGIFLASAARLTPAGAAGDRLQGLQAVAWRHGTLGLARAPGVDPGRAGARRGAGDGAPDRDAAAARDAAARAAGAADPHARRSAAERAAVGAHARQRGAEDRERPGP